MSETWLMNQVLYKFVTRHPCNHRCYISKAFVISFSLENVSIPPTKRDGNQVTENGNFLCICIVSCLFKFSVLLYVSCLCLCMLVVCVVCWL